MDVHCSKCHHAFAADTEPLKCPNCKAEAGLEPTKAVPVAMKLFGLLVVGVLVAAFSGGLISRFAG